MSRSLQAVNKDCDIQSFCQSGSTPVIKLAQPCGLAIIPVDQKKNKVAAKLVCCEAMAQRAQEQNMLRIPRCCCSTTKYLVCRLVIWILGKYCRYDVVYCAPNDLQDLHIGGVISLDDHSPILLSYVAMI